MRVFFLALLLMSFTPPVVADNLAFAKSFNVTPSGGTPLAATYSTPTLSGIAFLSQVCVWNNLLAAIDVQLDAGSTAPGTGSPEFYILPGTWYCTISHGNYLYVRSHSGSQTSGGNYFGGAR